MILSVRVLPVLDPTRRGARSAAGADALQRHRVHPLGARPWARPVPLRGVAVHIEPEMHPVRLGKNGT